MIGKDAYRDEDLNVAHDLLTDPIEIVGGNKFDAASKQYLFMVLKTVSYTHLTLPTKA